MTVLYADTSAVFRAYFKADAGHDDLRKVLIEGADPVTTSELIRVEFASAAAAARRAGKVREIRTLLDRFALDSGVDGPITLLQLDTAVVLVTRDQAQAAVAKELGLPVR